MMPKGSESEASQPSARGIPCEAGDTVETLGRTLNQTNAVAVDVLLATKRQRGNLPEGPGEGFVVAFWKCSGVWEVHAR